MARSKGNFWLNLALPPEGFTRESLEILNLYEDPRAVQVIQAYQSRNGLSVYPSILFHATKKKKVD